MERPSFDSIKSYSEFQKYYWYRDELRQICRDHGLKCPSDKIQLNKIIEAYFNGQHIKPDSEKKQVKSSQKKNEPLSLDTGLIQCGFSFGPRFRTYFEELTGIKPFKFNVDMVATVRAVKETGDDKFTLGDLLEIYYGKKVYATYDKSALQWNKFVKDFFSDPDTLQYKDRLKKAASLWKIVRDSDKEKIYTHELLTQYKDELK